MNMRAGLFSKPWPEGSSSISEEQLNKHVKEQEEDKSFFKIFMRWRKVTAQT